MAQHRQFRSLLFAPIFVTLLTNSMMTELTSGQKYPDTKTVDQVDDYHGTMVSDPST